MQITRKEFLGRLFRGAAGGVGVAVVAACGESSGRGEPIPDAAPGSDGAVPRTDGGAASCTANGTISTISGNHGHLLLVSKADVAAGDAKTYDIRGTADHAHSITVTTAMFTMLRGDTAITAISSRDSGHMHTVMVMCA
jgi:hypothetical protein